MPKTTDPANHPAVVVLRDASTRYFAAEQALAGLRPGDSVETARSLAEEYTQSEAEWVHAMDHPHIKALCAAATPDPTEV